MERGSKSWKSWRIATALVAAGAIAISGKAQQTSIARAPEFAVVSIRKSHSQLIYPAAQLRPGQFAFRDGTVAFLIQIAYGLQIPPEGGADWVYSERFDLDAKAGDAITRSWKSLPVQEQKTETLGMLRTLLAERFHLRTKLTTRKMPVYVLTVAEGGPKLISASAPQPKLDPKKGWATIQLDRASLAQFAQTLRAEPELQGREVIDETGLTGLWRFNLQWRPMAVAIPRDASYSAGATRPWNETPPSSLPPAGFLPGSAPLFEELKQELGLELVPEKRPVQVLVIDHIRKP